MRRHLVLALTTALAACTSGGKDPDDTDIGDVDTHDTDNADTDLMPEDTDAVDTDNVDTDVVDTDPADSDVVDTDPADSDVLDTDPGDTDTGDSGSDGDTDITDTDTGVVDTDTTDTDVTVVDLDLDGVPADLDCDDQDSLVFPGAPNLCNGVDRSCGVSPIDPTGTAALQAATGAWTDVTASLSSGTYAAPASYDVPTDARLRICGGTWAARLSAAADATIEGIHAPVFDQGSPYTGVSGYGGGVTIRGIVVTGTSADSSALMEVSQGTARVEDVELIGRVNGIAVTSGGQLTLIDSSLHGQTGNGVQLWTFGTPASATVSGVDVHDVDGTAFAGGSGGTLSITNSTLTDVGKGVQTNGAEVTLTDVTMTRPGQPFDGSGAGTGHFLRLTVTGHTANAAWYGGDLDITASSFSSGVQALLVTSSASLMLTDVTFSDLDAGNSWGAGLFVSGAPGGAVVKNCTFERNHAYYGGAVFASVAVEFSGTEFVDCTSYAGGAVYLGSDAGLTTFDAITAKGNQATSSGGAIFSEGGVTMTRSTLTYNTARTGGGGAVFVNGTGGTAAVLTGNTFESNSTDASGGAVYAPDLTSTDNTYSSCSAAYDGGAVFTAGSRDKVVLSGDTFTGNTANVAGGAIAWTNGIAVTNSFFDAAAGSNSPRAGAWTVGPVSISLPDGSFVCTNDVCN